MYGKFQDFLKAEIQSIKDAGLYKTGIFYRLNFSL